MAQRTVASIGQERRSFTLEKKDGNGVALSRASAHQSRPTMRMVPMVHMRIDRRMMNRRPKVAPALPVAWLYTSATGNEPLLFATASRSLIP